MLESCLHRLIGLPSVSLFFWFHLQHLLQSWSSLSFANLFTASSNSSNPKAHWFMFHRVPLGIPNCRHTDIWSRRIRHGERQWRHPCVRISWLRLFQIALKCYGATYRHRDFPSSRFHTKTRCVMFTCVPTLVRFLTFEKHENTLIAVPKVTMHDCRWYVISANVFSWIYCCPLYAISWSLSSQRED